MLCKGVIKEQNTQRACWLPAQTTSSFYLCRRCHFHTVTSLLDSFTRSYAEGELHPPHDVLLNDTLFLNELLHPAREQALLNCLSALFSQTKSQFETLIKKLKKQTVFSILITKRIETHMPSPKCKMYRYFLEDPTLYRSKTICWNCSSCISWILRRGNSRLLDLYTETFLLNYSTATPILFQQGGLQDIFVSLAFIEKEHHIHIWLTYCLYIFPFETCKILTRLFLQDPSMWFLLFEQREEDYFPAPLRDVAVLQEFKAQVKASIKQKQNRFKEELMMKTWHPSRLFPWCLDIDEWVEFGVSSADCWKVYEDFILNCG